MKRVLLSILTFLLKGIGVLLQISLSVIVVIVILISACNPDKPLDYLCTLAIGMCLMYLIWETKLTEEEDPEEDINE